MTILIPKIFIIASTAVTFPVLEFLVAFCLALITFRAALVALIGRVSVEINFKLLIYVIARATVPTILVTVGITIQRVTGTLLNDLLGFLEFLLEFLKFLGQISHLSQVTTALLPGLLRGIEGL